VTSVDPLLFVVTADEQCIIYIFTASCHAVLVALQFDFILLTSLCCHFYQIPLQTFTHFLDFCLILVSFNFSVLCLMCVMCYYMTIAVLGCNVDCLHLSDYLSVCRSVCVLVRKRSAIATLIDSQRVCLWVCLSVCLSVCPHFQNTSFLAVLVGIS